MSTHIVLFLFLSFSFSAAFSLCRKRKSGKEEIRFLYAKYGFNSSSMAAARAASFLSASASESPRTPEIGLKKALGARKRKISSQFLTEAGVLTCIGGILGVLVGIGLAYMVSRVSGVPIFISWYIVAATVVFSFIVGLFFGAVPAVQAARLNPIDALRRE